MKYRQQLKYLSSFPICLLLSISSAHNKIAISETTLANGLRVVVVENHAAPAVTVQVRYRVGSYYEQSGLTGISHLLEHMMFKGSRRYPKGKHSELIEIAGGIDNAYTSDHYTVYWEELAAKDYELALKLEADRMQNLIFDPVEFEREKNVVMEERRLGENEPYDILWEQFYAAAFTIHPYRNPVIGWMDDLQRITLEDLRSHYQRFYHPANAILLVVGDVVPEQVFKRAAKWFGRLKPRPVGTWNPVEPPQLGERRILVRKDIAMPALMVGYHVPGTDDPDFYALEVIEALLFSGRSSRLYSELVYRHGKALQIWGGNDTQKDPGIFYVFAVLKNTDVIDTVERRIYAQLESLKTTPVSDSELTRVKNRVLASFVFAQERNRGLAEMIGRSYSCHGSRDFALKYPERIGEITQSDLLRVARKYFVADNRTAARLLPRSDRTEGR